MRRWSGDGRNGPRRGTKAHGRIGCWRPETEVDTTDSSVEQRPEVGCSRTEAIAQTPVWFSTSAAGGTTGSSGASGLGFGRVRWCTRHRYSEAGRWRSAKAESTRSCGRARFERSVRGQAMIPGLVHASGHAVAFPSGHRSRCPALGSRSAQVDRRTRSPSRGNLGSGVFARCETGFIHRAPARCVLPTSPRQRWPSMHGGPFLPERGDGRR